MEGIRRKLGSRWAYFLRESITLALTEDWQLLLSVISIRGLGLLHQPAASNGCKQLIDYPKRGSIVA